MKLLTALFFCITSIHLLSAQTISGIVLDASNNQPIPYSHIMLGDIVTVSNSNGEYMVTKAKASDTLLHVSYIGYHLREINLNSGSVYHKVYLEPSTTELDQVNVWTGKTLIEEVVDRFLINYNMDNLKMTSYYKEKLMDGDDSLYYLAEGILDIYHPFRVSNDETVIRPIRTRKKIVKEVDESEMTYVSGHAYDMVDPSIWREESFLSDKNRDDYEFRYIGSKPFEKHDVYVVIFEPKNSRGYIHGKLYIEDETFAIVRMEYQPDATMSDFWSDVIWVEEYVEVKGIYELTRVSFSGSWEEYGNSYHYESILMNNDIETASEMPKHPHTLGRKDVFFKSAQHDFTDEFWAGYNFMKLTSDEQD